MKFVIALNVEGRRENRLSDLMSFVSRDGRVEVLEGWGRKAITVEMEEKVGAELQESLSYATVTPARKLKLLG